MRIEGERVKRTRLIRGGRFVVAVEVEAVIPPDDPRVPCYGAETIHILRNVAERARSGDREWLRRQGRVYEIGRSALLIPGTRTLILFPRLPRMSVALLMAVVGAAALTLSWFHSRDMARRVRYATWKADRHEFNAGRFALVLSPEGMGKIAVRRISDGGQPPGRSDGMNARYALGSTRFATVKLDPSRSMEICQIMVSYHMAMSEKWRRACLRPWPEVEPDPPPPVDVTVGSIHIF